MHKLLWDYTGTRQEFDITLVMTYMTEKSYTKL